MSDYVQTHSQYSYFKVGEAWTILSDIEQSIKQKVESVGTPLKDWDIEIYRGVLTGYNEAFIISSETREAILNNCRSHEERQRTEEIIRPILRGRDIRRYSYQWSNLWIINTHNGIKGELERVHIEDYPAIKQHIDRYWDKVVKRADQGDTPYNLRNCAYLDEFSKPKIVWIELSDESKFTLCEDLIPLNTVFFLTGEHLHHILGLLNSRLIHWYFTSCWGTSSGVGTNRWLKYTIEQLPLVSCITDGLSELVRQRLCNSLADNQLDLQIDQYVCEFYGLSQEETNFILTCRE